MPTDASQLIARFDATWSDARVADAAADLQKEHSATILLSLEVELRDHYSLLVNGTLWRLERMSQVAPVKVPTPPACMLPVSARLEALLALLERAKQDTREAVKQVEQARAAAALAVQARAMQLLRACFGKELGSVHDMPKGQSLLIRQVTLGWFACPDTNGERRPQLALRLEGVTARRDGKAGRTRLAAVLVLPQDAAGVDREPLPERFAGTAAAPVLCSKASAKLEVQSETLVGVPA